MFKTQQRYFGLAVKSLRARSVRSWITIIGIVVSIAVILTLLTLSSGLQKAVVNVFEDFGTNRMIVLGPDGDPRGLSQVTLTTDTVKMIEGMSQFRLVIPRLILPAQKVEYRSKEKYVTVGGFDSDQARDIYSEYKLVKYIGDGQFMQQGDRNVAIIGDKVASVDAEDEDSWSKRIQIQNTIKIAGEDFKVIGTFTPGSDFDNLILIPLSNARAMSNKTVEVSAIDAVVADNVNLYDAKLRLERRLNQSLGEDNYLIITPEGVLRQFTQIITIMQAILIALASISLIVGAVGIMNTMFTSVLEREKEIGIMKSIGSRNRDIMQLFLMESGLIGLIGGIFGVILGIGISYMVGFIATAAGFALLVIEISPTYVVGCLVFSFGIGMISGIVPSYRASRKKIVDTLREA